MATLSKKKLDQNKKRRILMILVLVIMGVLGGIYLSYLFHQLFTQLSTLIGQSFRIDSFDFNYFNGIKSLLENPGQKIIFAALQVFWWCFLVIDLSKPKVNIGNVEVRKITDDIEIPIATGNNQFGGARFQAEDEKLENFMVFDPAHPIRGGLVVQMLKKHGKEQILFVGEDKNSIFLGPPGTGKDRRILIATIMTQILAGTSAVVTDVKADLYYFTSDFAKSKGHNAIAYDFRNALKGNQPNYLEEVVKAIDAGDITKAIDQTWDIASVLVGEAKGEKLWNNGEAATIAACILVVAMDAPREYRNMPNVYYFLSNMATADEEGNQPINEYMDNLSDDHPAKGVFAPARVAPYRTRGSFFTSALTTLKDFSNPSIADMTSCSDFDLDRLETEKTIIYLIVPDEKETRNMLVSILVTQIYMKIIDIANRNGLRLPIPIDFNLNELGNFPRIPNLPQIASAGRSRGVRVNIGLQSYQQGRKIYEKDFDNILTCCQVKVILGTDDENTTKSISNSLGKYTVESKSANSSVSDKNTYGSANSTNYSDSSNMTGRPLLMPEEVSKIKSPYALVTMTGFNPCINICPDLSEYSFNKMLGMGDPEHNRKLIMEKEAKRPIRTEHPKLKLWGVWKRYTKQKDDPGPPEYEDDYYSNTKDYSYLDM